MTGHSQLFVSFCDMRLDTHLVKVSGSTEQPGGLYVAPSVSYSSASDPFGLNHLLPQDQTLSPKLN